MTLKRVITEFGTGNDLHGGDYTKAAVRAVQDAIHHSSLTLIRNLGIDAATMQVEVTIGAQQPARVDLPISKDARQYYKSGPPFLQRYLPYGIAVLASRLLVLLIPVIGVAYPLLRTAPALYSWSMRRRIFRLYGELKYIEVELDSRGGIPAQTLLAQLQGLEARANHLQVPFAFAPFLYQLRNHIALVRSRIEAAAQPGQVPNEASSARAAPAPAASGDTLRTMR